MRTPTPIVGNGAKCKKRLAAPSIKVYSDPLAAKLQLRLWLAESRQTGAGDKPAASGDRLHDGLSPVGRAIVRQPKVFLFDEPLSNLDALLRNQVRAEFKKLHRRAQETVIYVTHD